MSGADEVFPNKETIDAPIKSPIQFQPKKSKQVLRAEQRQKFKEQEQQRKRMNEKVTKGEILPFIQEFSQSKLKLNTFDLVLCAVKALLIKHVNITEQDFNNAILFENEKLKKSNEVETNTELTFNDKFNICKEYGIDVKTTSLISKLKADTTLSDEEKVELLEHYGHSKDLLFEDQTETK